MGMIKVNAIDPQHSLSIHPRSQLDFDELHMCLSRDFNKLKAQWSILETRSIPSPSPRSYNPNVHCQYHQGASYQTVKSITLRYVTQEIIAQKLINHSSYFNDQLQYSLPNQYLI